MQPNTLNLIMYSKPGCHLCEGLQEKLEAIQQSEAYALAFTLDIRDITTRSDWFEAYQYEIPVLFWADADATPRPIPRPSPRASVDRVFKVLQQSAPQA